ncbi:hypothetical protein N7447_010779 [Penicillium robsamsonii]|uniref:uncharacterized protein n=1 Tax=Penicillium robsamsonii TaxID=1792511 RepID=UPI00254791E6|nr:uncharacterized protein N7447_010779 [Penicillium robsamsonii]KAJ5807323.1 hypothetical protein N7447_010779 [Penicillium robsamsonii]
MQYAPFQNGKEKSISFTFQYAACPTSYTSIGKSIPAHSIPAYSTPQPTGPPPTAPRGLSTLSTDTADSLTSLEQDAQVKIQAYENKSLRDETLLKSGLNAFLTWLPEASRTSIARDVIKTSSDRELYDVFMNLFTGLAVPIVSTLDQPERRDPSFAAQLKLRDNYRCVITGQLNTDQWEHEGELGDVLYGPTEGGSHNTFCVSGALRDTSNTWALLYKCFPTLREILSVEINTLRNRITLRD